MDGGAGRRFNDAVDYLAMIVSGSRRCRASVFPGSAMIPVCRDIFLDEREVAFTMIRAQGAGGQNVNKVSSAVHLRFDVRASSLPDRVKDALLALSDRRLSKDGEILIKSQSHRTQERNRAEALERLVALIRQASEIERPRVPTRPTRASQRRRVQRKVAHGRIKQLRGAVKDE